MALRVQPHKALRSAHTATALMRPSSMLLWICSVSPHTAGRLTEVVISSRGVPMMPVVLTGGFKLQVQPQEV